MSEDFIIDKITDYFRAGKEAVSLIQASIQLMPKGSERDKAEAEIARAERALQLSEVSAAKSLGYLLCQCKFPPEIMLSVGRHAEHDKEIFKCQSCAKQEPSEEHFRKLDRLKAHNEGRRTTWVDSRPFAASSRARV